MSSENLIERIIFRFLPNMHGKKRHNHHTYIRVQGNIPGFIHFSLDEKPVPDHSTHRSYKDIVERYREQMSDRSG
jgi:hypothetical protein